MKINVYNAAGGNPTAIIFNSSCAKNDYAAINHLIQKAYPDIEQVGFYENADGIPRLQMAGGEFCGNATRSMACLLAEMNPDKKKFQFQVSGFDELVNAEVENQGNGKYFCTAEFKGLNGEITETELDGKKVKIVDLGGIVHIVVQKNDFPIREDNITKNMKAIKDKLGVDNDAVGVLWVNREGSGVYMRPVVWVRDIDTCYDETSCGSGTIAVALVENKDTSVIQPTSETIDAKFEKDSLILASNMQKTLSL